MSVFIFKQMVAIQNIGIIIDAIYHNYSKSKMDQKSIANLAKDCDVTVAVLTKVRNILIDMKLLVVEGERRSQVCWWNANKCKPNEVLLREVYKKYVSHIKSRVKVENKKRSTLEGALETLIKLGYEGVIKKVHVEGFRTFTETIDLSKLWKTWQKQQWKLRWRIWVLPLTSLIRWNSL